MKANKRRPKSEGKTNPAGPIGSWRAGPDAFSQAAPPLRQEPGQVPGRALQAGVVGSQSGQEMLQRPAPAPELQLESRWRWHDHGRRTPL